MRGAGKAWLSASLLAATMIAPASAPGALAAPSAAVDDAGASAKRTAQAKRKKRRAVPARLRFFESCDQVVGFGDAHAERIMRQRYPVVGMPGFTDPNGPVPVAAPGGPKIKKNQEGAGAEDSYSKTNTQEEDVDEPDIVKTNGRTIFAIGGNSVHAIDPDPVQPALLDSLPLPGFRHELLLVGDRLLVVSHKFELPESVVPPPDEGFPPAKGSDEPPHPRDREVTLLTEVDVSNPAALTAVSSQEVDGRYISARLTGDQVRVVVSTEPAATIAPPSSLRSSVGGWVPYSKFRDLGGGTTVREPVLDDCDEIGRPGKFSGLPMLSVLTIDMAAGLPSVDAEGVFSDGEIVYASAEALYVASERWQGRLPVEDPSRAATAIHKFDITEPGVTTYLGSGWVRGRILNQFSMDEHERVLRVASTGRAIGADEEDGEETFVSTLAQKGRKLALLGRTGNLGRGEDVYAVRMIGEDGYVVTFRRIDPLYTLDLSKPGYPRVLGKLEIPGYSAYLHPIGKRLLLGVGAAGDGRGLSGGAEVSLFDVSDLSDPRRLAQATVSGGRTSVEDTHLAFLYWPPSRRAVIPVDARWAQGQDRFLGAVGFEIGKRKITRVGKIVHSGIEFDEIQRSLVVGNRLFTLSCTGVEVAEMARLTQLGWTPFPDPDICDPGPYWLQ